MPTYTERRALPHTPDELFAMVADVERYPEFLPWCLAARVTRREEGFMWADLVIGFTMVRERFSSRVEIDREGRRIEVREVNGPFKHLSNRWVFEPDPRGCVVDFAVDFEFRSPVLRQIMGVFFHEAVRRMVRAFEERARRLYGTKPSPPIENDSKRRSL